ncbi:hypothetical protein GCM10022248_67850 [Nonomuraea soli]
MKRAAGAAILGGLLGAGISLDYDWAVAAGRRECQGVGALCIGTGPVVGFAAAVIAVVLVCSIGFAVLRVRPLLLTVPAGIVLIAVATYVYLRIGRPLLYPQHRDLHPLPAYALLTAAALALPATLSRTGPPSRS